MFTVVICTSPSYTPNIQPQQENTNQNAISLAASTKGVYLVLIMSNTKDTIIYEIWRWKNITRKKYNLEDLVYAKFYKKSYKVLSKPVDSCAEICTRNNLDPSVVIEACFRLAWSQKHPDGPMYNMLGSESYIVKALSKLLDLPIAAVLDRSSSDKIIQNKNSRFSENIPYLLTPGMDIEVSLLRANNVGSEFRFVLGHWSDDLLLEICEDLLDKIDRDSQTRLWLESRGWTYEQIADKYNGIKQ